MIQIKILTGSIRPGRFNIQPATWIYEVAKSQTGIETELLDLQEIALPFLDEANLPSQHQYEQKHTQEWAEKIGAADGFVFVTPEYNHGISPVLKNAVDFLYEEWNYKPIAFVSYGSLAGGSRAVEHWRGIAAELKMYDLRPQIMIPNYYEHLDSSGKFTFSERYDKNARLMLKELAFWAEIMKLARIKLQETS